MAAEFFGLIQNFLSISVDRKTNKRRSSPFWLGEVMWVHHVMTGVENLDTSSAVELTHEDCGKNGYEEIEYEYVSF